MAAKYNGIQEFLRARADHIDCRIQEIVDKNEKEAIARDILNGLPEWFGMSDSTEEYIKDSQDKPFIACFIGDEAVGFVVPARTAQKLGYTYSQVKTVQQGHYQAYDITNHFYISMGYKELECFSQL